MDERDMEEKGKDCGRRGVGIGIKNIIFLNFFELLIYVYVYICMFIMYFGI
jgi:hypothetical protein